MTVTQKSFASKHNNEITNIINTATVTQKSFASKHNEGETLRVIKELLHKNHLHQNTTHQGSTPLCLNCYTKIICIKTQRDSHRLAVMINCYTKIICIKTQQYVSKGTKEYELLHKNHLHQNTTTHLQSRSIHIYAREYLCFDCINCQRTHKVYHISLIIAIASVKLKSLFGLQE